MTPKRISYLHRREDLEQEAFSDHWSRVHSQIAMRLPGVRRYAQNHVAERLGQGQEGASRIDGMVELWFVDEEAPKAGFDSDVARDLAVDEPNFIGGLGGSAVTGEDPDAVTALAPAAAWIIADSDDLPPDACVRVAEAAQVPATRVTVNLARPRAVKLERPPLVSLDIADVAISAAAESVDEASAIAARLEESDAWAAGMRNPRLLVVQRRVFI